MLTHRVTIKNDFYEHDGKKYIGTDALGHLCRELVSGRLECYRGDMLCLTVDVAKRAARSLFYADKRGYGYRKYVPFDASCFK